MMRLRSPLSFLLVPLLLSNLLGPPAQAQGTPGIQIVIVEGEGAINNVKERLNREVIVQVEDQNHKPVAGAAVSFFLPNDGPGGTFANGTNNLTTTTNAQGRATARGIQFNAQAGAMQIRVAASYAGRTASIVVNQSNVLSGASTPGSRSSSGGGGGGMSTSTKLLIIGAIVGGGVAAGVLLGTRSSTTSTPAAVAPPTITITPGLVTVGGPQ